MIFLFVCYECGQIYNFTIFENKLYIVLLGKLISKEQLLDKNHTFRCIDCKEKDNFLILKAVN